jgi:hypothetical protein
VETKPFQCWGVGGSITIHQEGQHEHLGRVSYHPDLPNLISYGECKKRAAENAAAGDSSFSVHMDNEKDVFIIVTPHKTYEFRNNGRGLYTTDLSNEVEEVALSAFMVEIVAENEKLYSRKQDISYSDARGQCPWLIWTSLQKTLCEHSRYIWAQSRGSKRENLLTQEE